MAFFKRIQLVGFSCCYWLYSGLFAPVFDLCGVYLYSGEEEVKGKGYNNQDLPVRLFPSFESLRAKRVLSSG